MANTSPGCATYSPGGHCYRGGPARTLGRGNSHRASFVALTPQPASHYQCQCCRHHLPCPPELKGLVQGLVVLGVIILGDDKRIFFVIILLLLLVVAVIAEGCQCPPHDLGTREALERGPCFIVGHAPLDSESKLGCCHDTVVRAHPCAAVSASHADFAPDGSGRQRLEQHRFCGAHACDLVVVRVVLVNPLLCLAVMAGRRRPRYLRVRPRPWVPRPTQSRTAALQNRPR
jgi:hypothetical protein